MFIGISLEFIDVCSEKGGIFKEKNTVSLFVVIKQAKNLLRSSL